VKYAIFVDVVVEKVAALKEADNSFAVGGVASLSVVFKLRG
jgi:hypothetical protein